MSWSRRTGEFTFDLLYILWAPEAVPINVIAYINQMRVASRGRRACGAHRPASGLCPSIFAKSTRSVNYGRASVQRIYSRLTEFQKQGVIDIQKSIFMRDRSKMDGGQTSSSSYSTSHSSLHRSQPPRHDSCYIGRIYFRKPPGEPISLRTPMYVF